MYLDGYEILYSMRQKACRTAGACRTVAAYHDCRKFTQNEELREFCSSEAKMSPALLVTERVEQSILVPMIDRDSIISFHQYSCKNNNVESKSDSDNRIPKEAKRNLDTNGLDLTDD